MFENNHLRHLEKNIIESNKTTFNKKFLELHFSNILSLIDPLITDNSLIINEFQDNLLNHLFSLCFGIDYIPSIFIKKIAEISCSIHTLEYIGILKDMKS